MSTISIAAEQTGLYEGNFGTTVFLFTVSRTSGTGVESVDFTVGGAGINTNDFPGGVIPSGTVTFADGETSKTVAITIATDQAYEEHEPLTVTLVNPSLGSTLGVAVAVSAIYNDDQTVYSNITFTLPSNAVSLNLLGYDNINGTGNAGDNFLRGNDGNNVLEGLDGDDSLFGGMGRDTASYANATGGVKVDLALTDWQDTLGAGKDRLNSIENLLGSAFSDTLLGNTGNNVLTGGDGADVLDGRAGYDSMYGGNGSDKYYVDNAGDLVVESAGNPGDVDEVYSSISYTLRQYVENLILTGTDAINGTGNSANNFLKGNDANNVLEGMGGDDAIYGGFGRDTASYEHAASGVTVSLANTGRQDTVGAGKDLLNSIENLTGSAFDDKLTGNQGDNVLTGLGGADQFIFFKAGASNGFDRVADFSSAEGDKLVFKGADYGFGTGHTLTELTLGASAVGSGAQFVFNSADKTLYWDADGAGGAAAIKVVKLDGVATLTGSDFLFT